jgi:tetratricopeptide (TPR) repeat protein
VDQSLTLSEFDAALKMVDTDPAPAAEKAEMLMEIAMGMQTRPKSPEQLEHAALLYRRALAICPAEQVLLHARITIRLGTCLQAQPHGAAATLKEARDHYESALPVLQQHGRAEEVAETELNLGLVFQALAADGAARLHDAIQCYHRALRTFTRERYPQEYAILHNNLAVAYLSIPLSDEHGKMREALAVQSFEAVLSVIGLVDHPSEYAMIQNNLGNALQYAASGHPLENNLRALEAYDEALKVRNARDTPLEYANTIANKANVLRSLPDVADAPPGAGNLRQAQALYREARQIFQRYGQFSGMAAVDETLRDIASELQQAPPPGARYAADAL